MMYNPAGQLTELSYNGKLIERRGYDGMGGNWDSRPDAGLKNYGNLWRVRLTNPNTSLALYDTAWAYDPQGNVTRSNEAVRGASNAWPTSFSFLDAFDSKDTTAYSWNSRQTVPYSLSGNNVVRNEGTTTNYDASFYRNSGLTSGNGMQVRFMTNTTNGSAIFALETSDSGKRLGVVVQNGVIQLQYNDGSAGASGWRFPTDLVRPALVSEWYVLRIVIDDTRGSYVEIFPERDPSKRASYQQWMPAGQTWRFRHWTKSGIAYLDDYREFNTNSMTWDPDERINYGYDALNRLLTAVPDSGAAGFTHTYNYDAIGNITFRTDVGNYAYPPSGANSVRPHAATSISGGYSYTYDANGNMLTRTEGGIIYTQSWDEENRLKSVTGNGHTVTYSYDGDSQRVQKVQDGQTTVYVDKLYEKNLTIGVVTRHYFAGSQHVAQREGASLSFFAGDQLGSTSVTTDENGIEIGRQRYFPFGSPRAQSGNLKTDRRFTGQRSEEQFFGSLYDFNARFYSPTAGRFLSPDTIVPQMTNPQSLNRYADTANNPLRFTDPTGHWLESALDIAFIIYDIKDIATNGLTVTSGLSLVADVAGLALPAVTGGGLLVRGVAHADDVIKAASHVERCGEGGGPRRRCGKGGGQG